MKKIYKLLILFAVVEFIVVCLLRANNFKIDSYLGNAIGVFLFLLPIQILLFMLSKDNNLTRKIRLCLLIVFWFINICYVGGGVALLLA